MSERIDSGLRSELHIEADYDANRLTVTRVDHDEEFQSHGLTYQFSYGHQIYDGPLDDAKRKGGAK